MNEIEMVDIRHFMKKHNITCIYDGRNIFDTYKMMRKMNMPNNMPLFYWSERNNIGYNIQHP